MSAAWTLTRAGKAAMRLAIALAAATAAMSPARADDLPKLVSPLRIQPDVNGVNLATGRIAIDPPVLSVPAAPNLRFDRVQNALAYMKGKVVFENVVNYSIHTGSGVSEAFRCTSGACESVTGTGSTLSVIQVTQTGIEWRFTQAGSGVQWNFTAEGDDSTHLIGGTSTHYATSVVYPNGERLDYTHQTATGALGQRYFRTTRISSNLGYYIAIAYQGSILGEQEWNTPSQAALYRAGTTPVLLRRFTYTGLDLNGMTGTVTDWGDSPTDTGGRVYTCTSCNNSLGVDVEVWAGSLRLPGESSPTLQVAQTAQVAQGRSGPAQLIGSVTRDGVAWTYTYANLTYETLPAIYRYDSVTVTGPNGFNRVYGMIPWDTQIVASVREDVNEGTLPRLTQYRYDTVSRPDQITYHEGNRVTLYYDDFGNIATRTTTPKPNHGLEEVTETALYPLDCTASAPLRCYRPTWMEDALGRRTDFVHDANGLLTSRTDPADRAGVRRTTVMDYQTPGPEATQTTATGLRRRWRVTVCGTGATCGSGAQIRTETDYWNSTFLPRTERRMAGSTVLTTQYVYDDAGRILSIDGPRPGTDDTLHYRYDSFGRRIREVGPLAGGFRIVQLHHYRASDDQLFRTETGYVVNPDDVPVELRQVDYGFDSRRNRTRETLSSVNSAGTTVYHSVLQRRFDDRGQLECEARRMNPAQLATSQLPADACERDNTGSFGYDRITRNSYDLAGQLFRVQRGWDTPQMRTEVSYTYTGNGQRASVTDANGNRAELRYDGFDRLSRWVFPSTTTGSGQLNEQDYEEYRYDDVGNRTWLRKRDGSVLTYQYDNLNRMIRKTVPSRTGLDEIHTKDIFYDYNVRDQMTDARFDSWSGPGVGHGYDGFGRMTSSSLNLDGVTRQFTFAWDAAGNRTGIHYPNAADFTYAYDAAGRLTSITDADAGDQLFAFSYDVLGRLDVRTDPGAGGVDHGYDRVDRLTAAVHTFDSGVGNVTFGFTYNPASQIATRTRSNDAYASTSAYDVSRGYQVNGLNQYVEAGSTTFDYDANGNLTRSGTTTYTYDIENRLVGASGGRVLRYDPLGRLYEVTGASGTRRFIWDGDAMAAEYTTAGSLGALHLHGSSSGDDPLMWRGGGENRRLHSDHQGSIIAITNHAGTAQWINGYDAWGIPNDGNGGRFQYTGQIWLADFGIYHYKARMYSPTLGRFLQTDPVGYDDQINLYAYVGNDPMNRVDPSGTTCTQVGTQDGGAAKYSCQVDAVRYRDSEGVARTRAATPQENNGRFRRFNREYTRAVNRLARDPGRPGNVPALQNGQGAFRITAGESASALVSRQFVHDTTGEMGPDTLLQTGGIYNPTSGRVEGATTYVSDRGLNEARQSDIVHDGGMHSTYQEWTGGLQLPGYPLGRPPLDRLHQQPYDDAACSMLGISC